MFCQIFSLQNKSFLCLQHVENKGFQTVIKHRLKAIQKPIKNELGNREKNTENAHFVLKKCTFRFRDYTYFLPPLMYMPFVRPLRLPSVRTKRPSMVYMSLSFFASSEFIVCLIPDATPSSTVTFAICK